MDIWRILTNPVLLIPAFSWMTAQVLKAIINAIVNKRFSFDRLIGDGGMPSGHSATVTSLAVMCGFTAGFDSVSFAIAAILAIIVMHDATGVRLETGKQAAFLISIASVINDYITEHDEKIKTDKLKVLVGHTPLQVLCGALLGAAIAIAYYFINIG